MDNQYNYYRPDDNEQLHPKKEEKPKKKMSPFAKKAVVAAGLAVIFGVTEAWLSRGQIFWQAGCWERIPRTPAEPSAMHS